MRPTASRRNGAKDVHYNSPRRGCRRWHLEAGTHVGRSCPRARLQALRVLKPMLQLPTRDTAPWLLGPGDQAEFVRLHQARMRGHDAYAETVGAAFGGGD